MKGLKSATVASKKPVAELLKGKAEPMKDADSPKRPTGDFFNFKDDFSKSFRLEFPDVKFGPAVGKAGGVKWKSMSTTVKAPNEKASKRKAEYVVALQENEEKKLNLILTRFLLPSAEKSASACEIGSGVALKGTTAAAFIGHDSISFAMDGRFTFVGKWWIENDSQYKFLPVQRNGVIRCIIGACGLADAWDFIYKQVVDVLSNGFGDLPEDQLIHLAAVLMSAGSELWEKNTPNIQN